MMAVKDTPQLTEGFSKARNTAIISSGLLYLTSLFSIELPKKIPLIGFSIPNKAIALATLAVITSYAIFRIIIEWCNSNQERRSQWTAKADMFVSLIICIGALLCWMVADWTAPEDVSYLLSALLILFGLAFGSVLSSGIFSLQFIRTQTTALQLGLPKLPVTTRTSLSMTVLFILLLIGIWAASPLFSATMKANWLILIGVPAFLTLLVGTLEMLTPQRRYKDGTVVSRTEYLQRLQRAFDTHDAHYQLGGWDKQANVRTSELYQAAEKGHLDLVENALSRGGDPDEAGHMGWTPLMIAVAQQHIEVTKTLLEAGANPNVYNAHGRTPLMFASRYGNNEIVTLLLCSKGDPNLRGMEGEDLPLTAAAAHGHAEIVQLLLEAGADITLTNGAGRTALRAAENASQGEVAKILRRWARSNP
jgi:hypothetical protein